MVAVSTILKEDMLMQKSNLGQETVAMLMILVWIMKKKKKEKRKRAHFTNKQKKSF